MATSTRPPVPLDEVLQKIKQKPTALFFGAGVAMGCGGPSGGQLIQSIKSHFPIETTSTSFPEVMSHVIKIDNSNRKEVEDFIKQQLLSVSSRDDQQFLFSLPWRALLTTNYDSLPETITQSLDGNRTIVPIANPDSDGPVEISRQDLLYCFKLMGSTTYSFPDGAWMVLSSNDISLSSERRRRFFEVFKNLASSGQIIYLGYSFEDGVVLNLLQEMHYVLRQMSWKGFAISPTKPRDEIVSAMQTLGVEWVSGDLASFISKAKQIFGPIPISGPPQAPKLTVHGVPIELDRATISNIVHRYSVLENAKLERPAILNPRRFIDGTDDSFFPYVMKWDFPRRARAVWTRSKDASSVPVSLTAFSERWRNTNSSDNLVACLIGGAGAGKTVATRRLAFEWYQTGNPVVMVDPDVFLMDLKALEGLLDEIWNKYLAKIQESSSSRQPSSMRFLIIADDGSAHLDELIELKNHLKARGKPADILLIARKSEAPIEVLKKSQIDLIFELDDTISPQEWASFELYFSRLGVLTNRDILTANLRDPEINSSFFALVYSSVRSIQGPMRKAIEEEFKSLDSNSQKVYSMVSLIQSLLLKPWTMISVRSVGVDLDTLESEMRSKLGGVLVYREGQNVLNTPNRLVADIISGFAFKTSGEKYVAIREIVSKIQPDTLEEVGLIHNMLTIPSGFVALSRNFSDKQKVEIYEMATKRVPSRPLFIHLAMAQMNAEKFEDAKLSLNRAKFASMRGFHEPDQHVYDAEGRLEIRLAEDAKEKNNPKEAFEHLLKAEDRFNEAKISPSLTPHSYQGLGKTYVMMSELAPTNAERWQYLLYAIQELVFAENALGEWANRDITLLKFDVLRSLDKEKLDESKVDQISTALGQANGYAFLALRDINNASIGSAMKLVEKGLTIDRSNLWLIRQHVNLIKRTSPSDWNARRKALIDYESVYTTKFDVTLTFELAMQKYADGDPSAGDRLFNILGERGKDYPGFLQPLEENRWKENGQPRNFKGVLIEAPAGPKYGKIECFQFPRKIPARRVNMEFEPQGGERVTFEIIFNLAGPQASRVRAITR